ncbi:MAG TPA: sigma-70 family RNA polymerase sigma factor [Acetobacteraceae bacterium]|nr:sigma-70 family RNA polymerase sigma factor [Acetobacteraceae bacterium]
MPGTMNTALETRLAAAMAATQAGDALAYQDLLRAAVPLVAATARRRGVPADRVDDVVQETLLAIHRARHTYDPARRFLPWLQAIAERRAVDALRTAFRHKAREVYAEAEYDAHPDSAPDAVATLERAEANARLRAAIATLPAGQREAVEQLGQQERSLEEAARLTGRSKSALKVNLHRALKSLRARLTDGGRTDV